MGQLISKVCRCFQKENKSKVYQKPQLSKGFSKSKSKTFVNNNSDQYDSSFEEIIPSKPKNIEWRAGELIGQGSYGRVYMGMDIKSGKMIAVKQIELGYLDSALIQSFYLEVEILSCLKHPNIVELYGYKQTDKHLNILLEYVGGGSIAQMLRKYKKFSEPVIQSYLKQILNGLAYLHKRKVIHRDIKGANILVDAKGVCKLADFGCSNFVINHSNSLKGTPNWMAPEVIAQQKSGRKSDIWSLGCLVIEMATGKAPWGHFSNPIMAMTMIQSSKSSPPIPEDLSAELKDFLGKCLYYDSKQRWTARQLENHIFILQTFKPQKTNKLKSLTRQGNSPRNMSRPPTQKIEPDQQEQGLDLEQQLHVEPKQKPEAVHKTLVDSHVDLPSSVKDFGSVKDEAQRLVSRSNSLHSLQ